METLPTRPTALAQLLGISKGYASQILNGDKPWTKRLALKVFDKTGEKKGPLEAMTDEEVAIIARLEAAEAAQ